MTKLIYTFAILGITLATMPAVLATDLQNATTQVEQSHEELLQVNDDTALSPEEKLQKEISARVSIVRDALALSLQEIVNLKDSLAKLPQFTALSREDVLRAGFTADLKTFEDYYILKQDEVAKTTFTLESVKQFAKGIVDYRTAVYNPKTAALVDFTLLFYSEEATATAKTRLTKIISNIKTLERLNILKADYFQASIDASSALLLNSEALNLQARAIILALPAVEPVAPAPESPSQSLEQFVPPAPTANELLIKSLGNIKSAYEIFVQIGKETKKILGIR